MCMSSCAPLWAPAVRRHAGKSPSTPTPFTPSGQHAPRRKRRNACLPFHVTRVKGGKRIGPSDIKALPLLRAPTAARDENHAEAAGCQRGDPLTGKSHLHTRTHERRPTFYPGSRSTPPTRTNSGTPAPRPSSPVGPFDAGGGPARLGSARLGSAAAAVRRLPGILKLFNECVCCRLLLFLPPLSLSLLPPMRAASPLQAADAARAAFITACR